MEKIPGYSLERRGEEWGWLPRVLRPRKDDKEENLDQVLFKLEVLQGMARSEAEMISTLACQKSTRIQKSGQQADC